MHEKSSLSLVAALFVLVGVASVGATETATPAAEPAAAPALAADFTPGPACTETADAEALLAEIAPAPSAAEAADVLVADTGWRGICWTSCFPCYSDYDCPWGESCRFGVHCP